MYVLGGYDGARALNGVEVLDTTHGLSPKQTLAAGGWQPVASMLNARCSFNSVTVATLYSHPQPNPQPGILHNTGRGVLEQAGVTCDRTRSRARALTFGLTAWLPSMRSRATKP